MVSIYDIEKLEREVFELREDVRKMKSDICFCKFLVWSCFATFTVKLDGVCTMLWVYLALALANFMASIYMASK